MANSKDDDVCDATEFSNWRTIDSGQKSYLVQVLHWFHYRPTRLKSSWKQEEVLTWELIRALEVLPQGLFLKPMLARLASENGSISEVVGDLMGRSELEITAYPSLGFAGSKRNCKSDIGIGMEGCSILWIEAKTARFRAADLEGQLYQQAAAMAQLMPDVPTALVTLLPKHRALHAFPNLDWVDVEAALEHCLQQLPIIIPEQMLSRGYGLIAEELLCRIRSHSNRALGWV